MTNPRRELSNSDILYLSAYASTHDCPIVAVLWKTSNAVIGYVFRVYLSLEPNGIPQTLLYAYVICTDKYSNCIRNINIDSLLYILKDGNNTLLILDNEEDYLNAIKCLGAKVDLNIAEGKLLCLNEMKELKEYIECITLSKST